MAKRTRRTAGRSPEPPAHDRRPFRRHPGVWLATLSTVVGVATGMFTLRDQMLPREAGTAAADSAPAHQQEVGRVCDELNDNDRHRARDETTIKRQLRRAKTTIAQRNALVDGVRRTAARSGHALAAFNALETPAALVAVRRDTQAAWNRHLARLRDYALSLDRAGTRSQLAAALDHLATLRPALARDSDTLRAGLGRLGAAHCDLEPQIVTRTFTLPPLPIERTAKRRTPNPPSEPVNPPPAAETPPPAPPAPRLPRRTPLPADAGVLYFRAIAMDSWSGLGPVPRRVFKTREPTLPVGWKVRLLRRSVARRATIG